MKPGAVFSVDGVPYDYIVIIDSGSKGSRVFVYSWLNPKYAFENGIDVSRPLIKLVKRYDGDAIIDESATDTLKDEQSYDLPNEYINLDIENINNKFTLEKREHGTTNDYESEKESSEESEDDSLGQNDNVGQTTVRLPKVFLKKSWHKKIKPGISSFSASPHKIGKFHIKPLIKLAASVVPKSQHSRTPVFLHSTAGMRLLTPTEQNTILENICSYIEQKSDFFIPDCDSHVNVIDGAVEGLYGWLSINYMKQSFDSPEKHQHGKNHTTYGLLDMGGASTQVVFQPNSTEIDEHPNNLFKIILHHIPTLNPDHNFAPPEKVSLDVYSDSFLGFGMYQARNRYLTFLVDKFHSNHLKNKFHSPIVDPCLPKGYSFKTKIQDSLVAFVGDSNFQACLQLIFPVLSNSTHNSANVPPNSNCKQLSEENDVSSCLLNDLIPAFDFDINHFIGVSGYWDSVQSLLSYDKSNRNAYEGNESSTYDYHLMYKETERLCSQSFSHLMDLNLGKSKPNRMDEDDLAELCFKSSWILNFLHIGLGFPRFGIDESPSKSNEFIPLELVEELGGSSFSWTLGRALLYANDEYVQAYNNYTRSISSEEGDFIKRPGFYHSASKSVYHFGAEQNGVTPRPRFVAPSDDEKYPLFDYESTPDTEHPILKWEIEPHRWIGFGIILALIVFIVWLMIGSSRRSMIFTKAKEKSLFVSQNIMKKLGLKGSSRYTQIPSVYFASSNIDLELNDLPGSTDQFEIESEEETN
jgi:Golgi nucleoside diphosphatase